MKTPQEYVQSFDELEQELMQNEDIGDNVKHDRRKSLLLSSLKEYGKQEYERGIAEEAVGCEKHCEQARKEGEEKGREDAEKEIGDSFAQIRKAAYETGYRDGEKKGMNDAIEKCIRVTYGHCPCCVGGKTEVLESARHSPSETMSKVASQIGAAVKRLGER